MNGWIVYDLEFTSWEGAQARDWSGPNEFREIVQIGAVLVDEKLQELDYLDLLVWPLRNPILSTYFTELTGISQAHLEQSAVDPAFALDRLNRFSKGLPLLANGMDGEILGENCHFLGIDNPFLGRTRNMHSILVSASGCKGVTSGDLPEVFGLPSAGRGHNALADARNVAAALAKVYQSNSKAFL